VSILHWIGYALLALALAGTVVRRTSSHPLTYALGFWALIIYMVTGIAGGDAWYWIALDAFAAILYVAAMMDVLSSKRGKSAPAPVAACDDCPEDNEP
jgi:hypothetical protein